jgi:hypothetical protein
MRTSTIIALLGGAALFAVAALATGDVATPLPISHVTVKGTKPMLPAGATIQKLGLKPFGVIPPAIHASMLGKVRSTPAPSSGGGASQSGTTGGGLGGQQSANKGGLSAGSAAGYSVTNPFTVSAGNLASEPNGVGLWAAGAQAFGGSQAMPPALYMQTGNANNNSNFSYLIINNIPAGNWLVTCNVQGGGQYGAMLGTGSPLATTSDVMIVNQTNDTNGNPIPITFGASFSPGVTDTIMLVAANPFYWNSCTFES